MRGGPNTRTQEDRGDSFLFERCFSEVCAGFPCFPPGALPGGGLPPQLFDARRLHPEGPKPYVLARLAIVETISPCQSLSPFFVGLSSLPFASFSWGSSVPPFSLSQVCLCWLPVAASWSLGSCEWLGRAQVCKRVTQRVQGVHHVDSSPRGLVSAICAAFPQGCDPCHHAPQTQK